MKSTSFLCAVAVALSATAWPLALGHAQHARPTEPLVLVVEVLERDPTRVIPCGMLGAQPRDVTARVLSIEQGTFVGAQILLRWPMCEFSQVVVGARYRVHLRRWADVPARPDTRYRVRRAEGIAHP